MDAIFMSVEILKIFLKNIMTEKCKHKQLFINFFLFHSGQKSRGMGIV